MHKAKGRLSLSKKFKTGEGIGDEQFNCAINAGGRSQIVAVQVVGGGGYNDKMYNGSALWAGALNKRK